MIEIDDIFKDIVKFKIILTNFLKDYKSQIPQSKYQELEKLTMEFLQNYNALEIIDIEKDLSPTLLQQLIEKIERLHQFFYDFHPDKNQVFLIKEKSSLQVEASFLAKRLKTFLKQISKT